MPFSPRRLRCERCADRRSDARVRVAPDGVRVAAWRLPAAPGSWVTPPLSAPLRNAPAVPQRRHLPGEPVVGASNRRLARPSPRRGLIVGKCRPETSRPDHSHVFSKGGVPQQPRVLVRLRVERHDFRPVYLDPLEDLVERLLPQLVRRSLALRRGRRTLSRLIY